MQKEIYIHVTKEETKAAVLENRKLVEVYLDRSFSKAFSKHLQRKGGMYCRGCRLLLLILV